MNDIQELNLLEEKLKKVENESLEIKRKINDIRKNNLHVNLLGKYFFVSSTKKETIDTATDFIYVYDTRVVEDNLELDCVEFSCSIEENVEGLNWFVWHDRRIHRINLNDTFSIYYNTSRFHEISKEEFDNKFNECCKKFTKRHNNLMLENNEKKNALNE